MNILKRPFILIIAVVLSCGLLFTGCNTKDAETSEATQKPTTEATAKVDEATPEKVEEKEDVTVTFANFSGSGDNAVYLEAMRDAFTEQFPNTIVEIETIGYGDYFTQMQTRVASNSAPDCYELNYENFVSYAAKDALMPLEDVITSTGFDASVINPTALDAFKTDDTQFGLPASFSNVLLIYNKELFDKANLDYPTSDWTWEDEQAAAEAIRALDDSTFGIYHPISFHEFYKVAKQNGGSLFNDDMTKFTLNSPENVETLQFMVDRIQSSNVMPTEAQLAGMGDWDLFKSGRLGMIVTGLWAFGDFSANCEFDWDIAVEPGNIAKATHFFSNGLVLNKNTEVATDAFNWIGFMSGSKEAALIRVDANWELPAVTYPDVLDAYMQVTPPDNKAAVFESLDYLVTPPVIEQFTEMSDIVGLHLSTAATGAATPQEALDALQAELESKITLN